MPKFYVKLNNHQGEYIDILERAQIEHIIDNLLSEEIVRAAYAAYVPGVKVGHATVNLQTGALEPVSLGHRESLHPLDDVRVYLFAIEQLDFSDEDLFDENELLIKKQYEKEGKTIEEFCQDHDMELSELEIEAILHHFDREHMMNMIVNQLDMFYE